MPSLLALTERKGRCVRPGSRGGQDKGRRGSEARSSGMAFYNFVIYAKTDFTSVDFNGTTTTKSVINPIYITVEDNDSWLGGTIAPAVDTNGQQTISASSDPSLIGLGIELHHPGGANTHTLVQNGAQDLRILDVSINGSPGYVLALADNVNAELTPSTSYTDNDPTRGQFGLLYSASAMPCFASGTLIATGTGPVAIENLSVGDRVQTADHGCRPVRWIGKRRLSAAELAANPKLRPIRISRGAMGRGLPRRDMLVSRQHRMLIRSKIALRMFDTREVLVPAVKLLGLPGVDMAEELGAVTYLHLLFDAHEIVFAEGCPTESLYPGPQAMMALPGAARAEIRAIFPDLGAMGQPSLPARRIPEGPKLNRLLYRHLRNRKPPLGDRREGHGFARDAGSLERNADIGACRLLH